MKYELSWRTVPATPGSEYLHHPLWTGMPPAASRPDALRAFVEALRDPYHLGPETGSVTITMRAPSAEGCHSEPESFMVTRRLPSGAEDGQVVQWRILPVDMLHWTNVGASEVKGQRGRDRLSAWLEDAVETWHGCFTAIQFDAWGNVAAWPDVELFNVRDPDARVSVPMVDWTGFEARIYALTIRGLSVNA